MEFQGIRQVSPQAAQDMVAEGALIVDVRDDAERADASIPGSLHLPLHELAERASELPRDRTLVMQCAMGGRSHHAARFLADQGYDAVNMLQGIRGWWAARLPLERGG